jgi:hypothetical protein
LTLSGVNDGYDHQFLIRATDIMGNKMIDSTTILFDSTKPFIGEPELDYNVPGISNHAIFAKSTGGI